MQAGLKLSGRYALRALLGRGGMGEVWRGVYEHLDRPVAVKVLREQLADPELAGRFRCEARIAERDDGDHMISVAQQLHPARPGSAGPSY
jgi:serine/threonine protein kinase